MEEKTEAATEKKKKKTINTSVFPELPVITTEHEYGSLGLGKEHLKPRPLGKECLKPRLFGLDNVTLLQCHSRQAQGSFSR